MAGAARGMSDAMLGALLGSSDPAVVASTRTALVAYCAAHPHLADVRAAWAAFHAELQQEIAHPTIGVAFPAAAPAAPVVIKPNL